MDLSEKSIKNRISFLQYYFGGSKQFKKIEY